MRLAWVDPRSSRRCFAGRVSALDSSPPSSAGAFRRLRAGSGASVPASSLKSIERFARAVYVPVEILFLAQPPVERLAIPDLRGPSNERRGRPSPDLLEMIDVCQKRQAWYRELVRAGTETAPDLPALGKAQGDVVATAASIRDALGLTLETQRKPPTWTDALRKLIERMEAHGILVMCSSVVLNNNRRRLRPEELRGFTLADPLAPLLFVNAAETKAAQMFTLAHQLAHAWLGQTGVCDAQAAVVAGERGEGWCDRVAAEILVPLEAFRAEVRPGVGRAARRGHSTYAAIQGESWLSCCAGCTMADCHWPRRTSVARFARRPTACGRRRREGAATSTSRWGCA